MGGGDLGKEAGFFKWDFGGGLLLEGKFAKIEYIVLFLALDDLDEFLGEGIGPINEILGGFVYGFEE